MKTVHGIVGPREAEKEELERKLSEKESFHPTEYFNQTNSSEKESFHPTKSFDLTDSVSSQKLERKLSEKESFHPTEEEKLERKRNEKKSLHLVGSRSSPHPYSSPLLIDWNSTKICTKQIEILLKK